MLDHHLMRLLPTVVAGACALTACGGGSSGGRTDTGSAAGGGTTTVEVHTTDAGDVLTDSAGRTLYVSDQENRAVLCASSACTAIWHPLTVASGAKPTAPMRLSHGLTTVNRPDGTSQVAFDGKPLYTFSFDHGAGQLNGEGQTDSFDGTHFTWHAASANGTTAPATQSPSDSGEYGDY